MSVRADNPCLRYIECGDDRCRTGGHLELHCQNKMSQANIATKKGELKLVFGKMSGIAAAKEIKNNTKNYLAFDKGILWKAVVVNPWCEEGQVEIDFVVSGSLDGVIAASVAEQREADRKKLAGELVRKEEERRKWQSRAQKHLDDLGSYRAMVKSEYGPRLTAEEKQKKAEEAFEVSPPVEEKQNPRSISSGVSAFNDFCNQMQQYIKKHPEYIPEGETKEYKHWPTSRFILKTIMQSELAAWYMTDLMDEHFTGPKDAGKIISMWMDFFESAKEGAVHGAAKNAFTNFEKLKVYISEAKHHLANYPKRAFDKCKTWGNKVNNAIRTGYEGAKDRIHVLKAKVGPKKSRFEFKKIWAPFKRGANGVRRLWNNIWEGDHDLKGKLGRGLASITLLPFVSLAAFAVNFFKSDPDEEGEREHVDIEVDADPQRLPGDTGEGSSYFRSQATLRFRDSGSQRPFTPEPEFDEENADRREVFDDHRD